MTEPFVSEIRIFSFGFVPPGWIACDGRLLPIDQHQPLFSLLGWKFGGNGCDTFALPNLPARRNSLIYGIAVVGLYPRHAEVHDD